MPRGQAPPGRPGAGPAPSSGGTPLAPAAGSACHRDGHLLASSEGSGPGKLGGGGDSGRARRGRGEAEGCPLRPRGPGPVPTLRRWGGGRTSAEHTGRCAQRTVCRTLLPLRASCPPRARGAAEPRGLCHSRPCFRSSRAADGPRHSCATAAAGRRGADGARNGPVTRGKALGPGPRAESRPPERRQLPGLWLLPRPAGGGRRGSWSPVTDTPAHTHAPHTRTRPNACVHMHTHLHPSTHTLTGRQCSPQAQPAYGISGTVVSPPWGPGSGGWPAFSPRDRAWG